MLYPEKINNAESFSDLISISSKILQENNPLQSSRMGIILYNNLWPDISINGVNRDIETLQALQNKLQEFTPNDEEIEDFELLEWFTQINLHELTELQWWKSAHYLASTISGGIMVLTRKTNPDKTQRLESIIARLRSVVPLIKGEQRRLTQPVDIWTNAEIYSINGLIKYLQNLDQLFDDIDNEELLDELNQASQFAIEELEQHIEWLESLEGGAIPTRKDAYTELLNKRRIGFTVEELEKLGWFYLDWTEKELNDMVKELDGDTVDEVRNNIRSKHAENFDKVIANYKLLASKARKFLIEKDLVTLPEENLEVIKTPEPLKKFLSIAAAGMPGRFDKDQTGYFYCTVHDDEKMLEEHSYAYQPLLISHESYPGHHLHGACKNKHPSMVRTSTFSHPSANTGLMYSSKLADITEGWGLYTEEMMWKAGFENDPLNPDLNQRFLQINAMRWRAARIVIDTKLHTGRMSYDEAVEFLIQQTGYHKTTAEAEVLMYSRSPGYFSSYLLGKHQLSNLYKKVKDGLSDKEFHNLIIYAGNVPYWFVERLVLKKFEDNQKINEN